MPLATSSGLVTGKPPAPECRGVGWRKVPVYHLWLGRRHPALSSSSLPPSLSGRLNTELVYFLCFGCNDVLTLAGGRLLFSSCFRCPARGWWQASISFLIKADFCQVDTYSLLLAAFLLSLISPHFLSHSMVLKRNDNNMALGERFGGGRRASIKLFWRKIGRLGGWGGLDCFLLPTYNAWLGRLESGGNGGQQHRVAGSAHHLQAFVVQSGRLEDGRGEILG